MREEWRRTRHGWVTTRTETARRVRGLREPHLASTVDVNWPEPPRASAPGTQLASTTDVNWENRPPQPPPPLDPSSQPPPRRRRPTTTMTAADVTLVLDRLDAIAIAWRVDGGWGLTPCSARRRTITATSIWRCAAADLARTKAATTQGRRPPRAHRGACGAVRGARLPARPGPQAGCGGAPIPYLTIVTKPRRPGCCGPALVTATLRS
jgi:hypothetical protein